MVMRSTWASDSGRGFGPPLAGRGLAAWRGATAGDGRIGRTAKCDGPRAAVAHRPNRFELPASPVSFEHRWLDNRPDKRCNTVIEAIR